MGQLCLQSPSPCVHLCLRRSPELMKALPQSGWSHAKGLSPVCDRIWVFSRSALKYPYKIYVTVCTRFPYTRLVQGHGSCIGTLLNCMWGSVNALDTSWLWGSGYGSLTVTAVFFEAICGLETRLLIWLFHQINPIKSRPSTKAVSLSWVLGLAGPSLYGFLPWGSWWMPL